LEHSLQTDLDKYVQLANLMRLCSESHRLMETDVIDGLDRQCE